ncbi:MAG: AGE family epimerase/isomerase, partial [Verrucomicrobiales bacterium]
FKMPKSTAKLSRRRTRSTFGGHIFAAMALLLGLCSAEYIPKSEGLTDPLSAIQFVTESADFWKSSQDLERGGFYTDVDREGNPTKQSKTVLTQSRHAFGFSKAFMLTGDESYLDLERSALDFQYAHLWDETNGGGAWKSPKEGR